MAETINQLRKTGDPLGKFYSVWATMKARCDNPNQLKYKNYGGRGIKYCTRWKSFTLFYEDMYESYTKSDVNRMLDRIDNDGDYSKKNCRWVNNKVQANNRRSNRLITYNGKTQTMAQWIDESKIKSSTFKARFYCQKWPFKDCFKKMGVSNR